MYFPEGLEYLYFFISGLILDIQNRFLTFYLGK